MSRLPPIAPEAMTEAQRAVYDGIVSSRRTVAGGAAALQNPDGSLIGPFNAMVHAPAAGARVGQLGSALRYETPLTSRQTEIAILVVGRTFKAEFEWWAHARLAREAGLSDDVINAIKQASPPPLDDAAEEAVHDFAVELVTNHRVTEQTYARAVDALDHERVATLVFLIGYYALISLTLNAHDVPLPNGVAKQFT